jgi:hypothetical protein
MRNRRLVLVCLLSATLSAGCGSNMVKAKGRVLKGGEPYAIAEDEGLRIFLSPTVTPLDRSDSYLAIFHRENGTFEVVGRDGKGLPPGNYRVNLELIKKKSDQFHGKYSGKRSPFSVEVTRDNKELLIDLETKSNG